MGGGGGGGVSVVATYGGDQCQNATFITVMIAKIGCALRKIGCTLF